ncbi:putative inner membrane or exported protein [Olavius algarvensis associated proteobacterium Delta 3]|nr:putative inner membrane or exported protein [Olavius algarvensis associated proteobacterium Delta 3]
MRNLIYTLIGIVLFAPLAGADSGMIRTKSVHDVKVTADRLESTLNAKGMRVFIRINHTEGAQKVGKTLRPTEVIIFGNPKVGTPLMQCRQSVAIDLPQKALIWEDETGQVWLSYNDPKYLVERHGITGCTEVIHKIENALKNFARAATMP